MKTNLINFVFASFILGLTCGRKSSQHNGWRGMATSLLHEGLPMVIYSQILTWGQSGCCLLLLCIFTGFNIRVPSQFATIVPLGIESGEQIEALRHIDATNVIGVRHEVHWVKIVLQESESLGLLAVCIIAIVLMSGKQFFIACGFIQQEVSQPSRTVRPVAGHGAGQAEAFERTAKASTATFSLDDSDIPGDYFSGYNGDVSITRSINGSYTGDKESTASLGAHLSLIALSVFLSFGLSFICRMIEIEFKWTEYFFSGMRF